MLPTPVGVRALIRDSYDCSTPSATNGSGNRSGNRVRALAADLGRVSSVIAFGLLPVLAVVAVLMVTIGGRTFLFDFRGDLYEAGRAIIHGRDPYPTAFLHHLAAIESLGGSPSSTFAVPVYPAPALLAAVPFALLPFRGAGILFTVLAIGALIGGLWLLGVRDWRCYGLAFLSWPVLHSLRLGQINEFLVFGLGAAWRWRGRLYISAIAMAAVFVCKLFLWPLGVLLLLEKRWKVAAVAVLAAVLVALAAWAVIGFDGISAYPRLLSDLSSVEGNAGVSAASMGLALGVSRTIADLVDLAGGAALLVLAWRFLRRPGGERRAFGLAVMAAIAASPLVWPHYLTLVLVPIALLSPRLSVLWLVPLIAYAAPVELTHGDLRQMVPYLTIELIVVAALCFMTPASGISILPSRSGSEST